MLFKKTVDFSFKLNYILYSGKASEGSAQTLKYIQYSGVPCEIIAISSFRTSDSLFLNPQNCTRVNDSSSPLCVGHEINILTDYIRCSDKYDAILCLHLMKSV